MGPRCLTRCSSCEPPCETKRAYDLGLSRSHLVNTCERCSSMIQYESHPWWKRDCRWCKDESSQFMCIWYGNLCKIDYFWRDISIKILYSIQQCAKNVFCTLPTRNICQSLSSSYKIQLQNSKFAHKPKKKKTIFRSVNSVAKQQHVLTNPAFRLAHQWT